MGSQDKLSKKTKADLLNWDPFGTMFKSDTTLKHSNRPDIDKILYGPYDYVINMKGVNIFVVLNDAFNHWIGVSEERMIIIRDITEMVRVSFLLVDDIEDRDIMRRSVPVTHSIYGEAHCINTANYVSVMGAHKALALKHPKSLRMYTEMCKLIGLGQQMDIEWANRQECPSEERYMAMVKKKTVDFFAPPIAFMQLFNKSDLDTLELMGKIGAYYQIKNDFVNLFSTKYTKQKGFCADITEGKFGFPVLKALKLSSPAEAERIKEIMNMHTYDEKLKRECFELIMKSGSKEACLDMLGVIFQDALDELKALGGNRDLEEIMDILQPRFF